MNVVLLCYSSLATQLIENYNKHHFKKLMYFSYIEAGINSYVLSNDWLKRNKIDLVVAVGLAYQKNTFLQNVKEESSIPFFLPNRKAAYLEQSKIFTKIILEKLNIPTARYQIVKGIDIEKINKPFVVKYDKAEHLLGRQTEIVFNSLSPRTEFNTQDVLVEEYLNGEEFSYQVICNGSSFTFLGVSKDYKKYKEYNTCGIAAVSEASQKNISEIDSYIQKILDFLLTINISYVGIMYLNIMKVGTTYYILEINTRFGEPETQSLFPTLSCDIFQLFYNSATHRHLNQIERTGNSGVCVQLIHQNYDETYKDECIFPKLTWSDNIKFGSQLHWSKNNVFGSLTAAGETTNVATKKIYDYLEDKYLGDFTFKKDLL